MTTQSITTLILGTAPENATPATHILAGPWCTAPASAEETGFDMPPEPLADPERLETAARQARQLVTQLAPRLRDYLNGLYGTQHDDRYWDFVLAPWLVRAVETLIDRLYRTAGILETFGGRPLSVPVLDASEFAFADTQDFIMDGILNPQWNHWLFSRLLKRDWPAAWTAEELPPVRREAAPTRRENLLKHVARNILFSLPFPRVKGFSLRQSFDLSVVLTLNRDRRDDTIPLRLLGDPSAPPLPLGFTEDEAFDLAVALLPESLRKASIPQTLGHEQARIRSRVVSVAACEDDAYRIKMALHRGAAAGCSSSSTAASTAMSGLPWPIRSSSIASTASSHGDGSATASCPATSCPCRIPSLRPCAMRTVRSRPRCCSSAPRWPYCPTRSSPCSGAAAIRLPGRQGPLHGRPARSAPQAVPVPTLFRRPFLA